MLYTFELFIFELIIYLSVILSSGYCNLYPAMLYFCILKSYQKAGYYIMSLLIFGGSLEFITVEMLLSPFAPLQVFIMALLIQARHLFYGISMLEKFKGTGWKKFFLIFGMCDETFSINYTAKIPEDVDKGWFMLSIAGGTICYMLLIHMMI